MILLTRLLISSAIQCIIISIGTPTLVQRSQLQRSFCSFICASVQSQKNFGTFGILMHLLDVRRKCRTNAEAKAKASGTNVG